MIRVSTHQKIFFSISNGKGLHAPKIKIFKLFVQTPIVGWIDNCARGPKLNQKFYSESFE